MDSSIPPLVQRVRQGDLDAFALLIARFRPDFGRYARHMLGNREDAEDALQETFVRAYRWLATCRDPERFGAWAFRILVNRCRTAQHTTLRRDRRMIPADLALNGHGVAPAVENHDWRDEIERALGTLAQEQREAFLLHHVEGYSYEEMQELTGAGVSALKMRVKRACERLRLELEDARHG